MTQATNAFGRPATGIPATQCPDWCTDPGHVAESAREDQTCYSQNAYVEMSLGKVEIHQGGGVFRPRIGAMAYRGFNRNPTVLIHLEDGENDVDPQLTVAEARQLVSYLDAAIDLLGSR